MPHRGEFFKSGPAVTLVLGRTGPAGPVPKGAKEASLPIMRVMTRLLLAAGLAVPAGAQQLAAPRVRLGPVPLGAVGAVFVPAAASPLTLSPTLPSLPSSVIPSLPAFASPAAVPAAALPAARTAAEAPRPMRLILMGAPGAGKTTYGKRLAADYGVVHISVGDLLRAYAAGHPEVGAVMLQGDLVDSELVLRLVRQRLSQDDVRTKGYALDGFPRRLEEALPLEGWLKDVGLDAVVHLEVPQEELLRRIHARGRPDDTEPVFANRMGVYRSQTMPVLERFRSTVGVLEPDVSSADPETNYARLRSILEEALRGR